MSVNTETSRSLATGNGATLNFPTGFYFRLTSELVVTLTPSGGTPVIQTEGVHYTVTPCSGIGVADGEVNMVAAPAVAAQLKIERTVPFTQGTSLRQAGEFDPAAHEDQFDEVVFQTQQLARRVTDLESGSLGGTFVAGNGLSVAGPSTLNVGAGAGIQANADTVEVLYGAAGAIADVTKAAAGAGVANTAARSDHKHNVSTAIAGALTVGGAAAEGASVSLARADHVHEMVAGVPVAVDAAAAAMGASGNFSDASHKHQVTVGSPVQVAAANADGVATSLARSDHAHAHGNQAGGALHADAIAGGAAGFLSGADKATIDAIGSAALKSKVTGSSTAPQSIATATPTVFTGFTETLDADNEFNPATGVYTAKAAGNVFVLGVAVTANVLWAAGSLILVEIRKNGVAVGAGAYHFVDAAATRIVALEGTRFFSVAIGDTIDVRITHNQGGNVNISAYLSIARFL